MPAHGADPAYLPGRDDWMIPPCQRPITPTYPERPPECVDGAFAPSNPGNGLAPADPVPTPVPGAGAAVSSSPAAVAAGNRAPPVASAAPVPIEASLAGAKPKALRLMRVRTTLRDGDRLGELKIGFFCNGNVPLVMNARAENLVLAPVLRPVREEFTHVGYPDPVGERGLFEEDVDQSRVDLLLGAMIEELNVSYCPSGAGTRMDGRVRVKIRWQLYDPIERKIVFTMSTEGSYQTQGTEQIRESELFERAYRRATRTLLADQKFHEASVDTVGPAPTIVADNATSLAESISIKRVKYVAGTIAANMTNIRAAVVTVLRPGAIGSGFFVGENGYVLTNSHVVSGSRFVRVKLATGRELVGEVIRQDSGRDVALIKTEGRNFAALPVAPDEGNVGGEVTAIGSPLEEALSGTVTRGIISAYRVMSGRRFIQSDVSVLPGNSGGPLLDSNGRVLGITVLSRNGSNGRINLFIPIQDALDKLALRVVD